MSDANWLRRMAERDDLTVGDAKRLRAIADTLDVAEVDAAIVRAIIEERGVELEVHDDSYGSFPSWTARKGARVGYTHDAPNTNLARGALIGFAKKGHTFVKRAPTREDQP